MDRLPSILAASVILLIPLSLIVLSFMITWWFARRTNGRKPIRIALFRWSLVSYLWIGSLLILAVTLTQGLAILNLEGGVSLVSISMRILMAITFVSTILTVGSSLCCLAKRTQTKA